MNCLVYECLKLSRLSAKSLERLRQDNVSLAHAVRFIWAQGLNRTSAIPQLSSRASFPEQEFVWHQTSLLERWSASEDSLWRFGPRHRPSTVRPHFRPD